MSKPDPTVMVSNTAQGDYPIVIAPGTIDSLAHYLPGDARKVVIIHAPPLAGVAERLREELSGAREVFLVEIPDAEGAKRAEVASFCWGILGQLDFHRN
ncbi:MAG: 3-dehydroquinate synthase, partial [Microbacteriaceae bacterium]|nr:3-dehydroquinate synthase [Microbacteriaceae bacterium]